ncbi:hypothetical protein B0I37DRAFT_151405 [Chaetomium sp. MPI-CAGE-AT-0009]|nr:hypothetical protein B0I37DRAFT_151405 [Chaetomium sp. MPI-CAGE-AT-0009]
MGYITSPFFALLNLIIPITDRRDIEVPALAMTSTTSVFNLFVIDPTERGPNPTIHAAIWRVDMRQSETRYYINCPKFIHHPGPGPCNYLDEAFVTASPTGMELGVDRAIEYVLWTDVTINGTGVAMEEHTSISVGGTATCDIYGPTSASCTGHMTSRVSSVTYNIPHNSTWGRTSVVDVETISTAFADVAAHSIPVTITAGFGNIPTTTAFESIPATTGFDNIPATTTTPSSNDGGGRATRQVYTVVAGALALAGGVALM